MKAVLRTCPRIRTTFQRVLACVLSVLACVLSVLPAMRMEEGAFPRTHDAPQSDLVRTKRLVLERLQAIESAFTVLLFPHRVGEELPLTTWNTAGTELTVDLRDGASDEITAKRWPGDPRTQLSVRRLKSTP